MLYLTLLTLHVDDSYDSESFTSMIKVLKQVLWRGHSSTSSVYLDLVYQNHNKSSYFWYLKVTFRSLSQLIEVPASSYLTS